MAVVRGHDNNGYGFFFQWPFECGNVRMGWIIDGLGLEKTPFILVPKWIVGHSDGILSISNQTLEQYYTQNEDTSCFYLESHTAS